MLDDTCFYSRVERFMIAGVLERRTASRVRLHREYVNSAKAVKSIVRRASERASEREIERHHCRNVLMHKENGRGRG